MIRSILSIVTGIVVWGVLMTSANLTLTKVMPAKYDENLIPTDPALLLGNILICAALCMLAGFLCATIARAPRNPMKHVWILAFIQLAIGIFVQASVWDQMPLWYHLIFLALVVPMHLAGGKLRTKNSGPRVDAQLA